jgi:hypothetical protein
MNLPKIYLALSCLQGRPMQSSAEELLALKPFGLQLTPGNAPTLGFENWLKENNINYLVHHGFCWNTLKQNVWDEKGKFLTNSHSVHPPLKTNLDSDTWYKILEKKQNLPILETMYPEYYLGNGLEIEQAMQLELDLAIDISHIFIQKVNNLITEKLWKKLQNYSNIKEIHVSANSGKRDSHKIINQESFGLEWAKERCNEIPVILECYMHRLSGNERLEQMQILLNPG